MVKNKLELLFIKIDYTLKQINRSIYLANLIQVVLFLFKAIFQLGAIIIVMFAFFLQFYVPMTLTFILLDVLLVLFELLIWFKPKSWKEYKIFEDTKYKNLTNSIILFVSVVIVFQYHNIFYNWLKGMIGT